MFSPSPYVPSIHLPDTSHNSYFTPQISPNMNTRAGMQRRADEYAERRARRAKEDEDELYSDLENDDDWDYDDQQDGDYDMDFRGHRDHDYRDEDRHTRRDSSEAVFFRRHQDALEIAGMEREVREASRVLENAKRNLRELKMRIKDRRREERQQLKELSRVNRSVPEFARPFVDDVYDRAYPQPLRDYLSPAGNRSRPPTPQPSSSGLPARSRSPSPYRFSSRTESESPTQTSQYSQSVHEPQPRSRTPDLTAHKEGEDDTASAAQRQVHQSFNKLHDLAKEFQVLKQNFVYPSIFEFQKPDSQVGEVIVVRARSPLGELEDDGSMLDGAGGSEVQESEGKLAYTRTNEALHTYAYAMEKLLGKLDSVDSWNETSVRTRRRGIVGDIEQEASKLERYRQKVWRDYLAQENVKAHG